MDQGKILATAALFTALLAGGCGSASDGTGPDAVMTEFLDAVKQGDDAKASGLLTTLAIVGVVVLSVVIATTVNRGDGSSVGGCVSPQGVQAPGTSPQVTGPNCPR